MVEFEYDSVLWTSFKKGMKNGQVSYLAQCVEDMVNILSFLRPPKDKSSYFQLDVGEQ